MLTMKSLRLGFRESFGVYPFCPGLQDQVFHSFFEGHFIIFTNLVGVFNVSTSQHYNVPGSDIFDEARN